MSEWSSAEDFLAVRVANANVSSSLFETDDESFVFLERTLF